MQSSVEGSRFLDYRYLGRVDQQKVATPSDAANSPNPLPFAVGSASRGEAFRVRGWHGIGLRKVFLGCALRLCVTIGATFDDGGRRWAKEEFFDACREPYGRLVCLNQRRESRAISILAKSSWFKSRLTRVNADARLT